MSISVRLPPRVEQDLADYCVTHKVTRSEAIKRALEQLLAGAPAPANRFVGSDLRPGDVARNTKALLRRRQR